MRRCFSIFLAILGLVLGSLVLATPAQASQALCGAYGQSPSFSCVSYSGFTGQRPWGYPVDGAGHNCTNYVTYRLWQNGVSNPGNLHNAYEWDNYAASYGIPVNGTPAVGSVAVWEINSGPALGSGHVAYVEAVTSSYIDISEDNYGGTTMRKRFFVGQSDWPNHFIHFKDLATPYGTMTPGVIRPEGATLRWDLRNGNTIGNADMSFKYATSTDIPIVGDWDGNGTMTPGVVRPEGTTLRWYLRNSNSDGSADISFIYGISTDIPVVGDWDGNGTWTPGVVRPENSTLRWDLRNSNSMGNGDVSFIYGISTDIPKVGDWDANGTMTPGVVRPEGTTLRWDLRNSNTMGNGDVSFIYGIFTDIPIVGDWDGGGSTTIGVVRPENSTLRWDLRNSNTIGNADVSFIYGISTDTPVVGDWD